MVLVDHEIAKLAREDELIGGYDESCVTNIGYDLRKSYFAVDQKAVGTTAFGRDFLWKHLSINRDILQRCFSG